MRIATWNIGGGFVSSNSDLEFDIENIGYFIRELKGINPDIVCFQEIHVSKENDQPKIIAKELGLGFVSTEIIADSHLKDGEQLSLSIVSKYPIISSKFRQLKNPNLQMIWRGKKALSHDKGFLEVQISYNKQNIRILCGHMVPFHKFHRNFLEDDFKQIRIQIEEIIREKNMPTIILADMNFEDTEKLIPRVFRQNYNSILSNIPTTPKNKILDKILISKEWICTNANICKGKADHYLCYADVKLSYKLHANNFTPPISTDPLSSTGTSPILTKSLMSNKVVPLRLCPTISSPFSYSNLIYFSYRVTDLLFAST